MASTSSPSQGCYIIIEKQILINDLKDQFLSRYVNGLIKYLTNCFNAKNYDAKLN